MQEPVRLSLIHIYFHTFKVGDQPALIGCAGPSCDPLKAWLRALPGTPGTVAAGGPKPPPQQGARAANLVFYESHPSIYHSYVWALAPGCTAPPLKEFKAMTVLTNYPISTDILRRTPFCVALEEVQESGSPPILLGVRCMLVPAGQLLDLQGGNPAPLLSVKIDPGSGFDDCKPGSTEVVLSLDPQLLALDEAIKLSLIHI